MKKIITLLLCIILTCSCFGCGDITVSDQAGTIVSTEELAQAAYDLIEYSEEVSSAGIQILSAAWHFGIYDAPECSTDTVIDKLAGKTGLEADYIKENGGYTAKELIKGTEDFEGWEFCLWATENCLTSLEIYENLETALNEAKQYIKDLPETYSSLEPLKEYYKKVFSYATLFQDTTGLSYNELQEKIPKYEEDIRTAKEELLFDFD